MLNQEYSFELELEGREEEGIEKGIEKGREEGIEKGRNNTIMDYVKKKRDLGNTDSEIEKDLITIFDILPKDIDKYMN